MGLFTKIPEVLIAEIESGRYGTSGNGYQQALVTYRASYIQPSLIPLISGKEKTDDFASMGSLIKWLKSERPKRIRPKKGEFKEGNWIRLEKMLTAEGIIKK